MNADPPLVSVVVPAHNAGAYLGECLRSALAQQGMFDTEVIVVDDGSTDDTAQIARSTPGVRYVYQAQRGPSAARNVGMAAACGAFIALLDADDVWPPGKLACQLPVLMKHPEVGMVFGDCRQFDADGPRAATLFETNRWGAAAWGPGCVVPDAYTRLLEDNFVTTGSVVIRRTVLETTGGFDEGLRLVEDLDLWLRVARHFPVAWCGDVCLLRRRHERNTSRDAEAMSLSYLEVLHKQFNAAEEDDNGRRRRIRALAAAEYRHLARSALTRGDIGLALQRTWQAIVLPWTSRRSAVAEAHR
jgi:glycosyltransferase involved in cell wall biosynthesis